ncbi:MAG: TlpA family protein disulfide reductase [Tannerella sp.]|jgi:peroxiredoxin|nr:TlpA family protein disulfide reductase [Tannerella sp.]
MNARKLLLSACIFGCALSYAQQNTIELPVTLKDGYGPFKTVLGGFSPDSEDENDPWRKTRLNVTGIPEDWTEVKKGGIETNIYQTVYQNYLLGNISQEWYEELQKSWNWIPDTLNLSKQAVKCKIAFAFGKDVKGETKMVVDANNNLDFSDDVIFTPLEPDLNDDTVNRDSLTMKHAITVTYERLSENKIIQESSPLFIVYAKSYNIWMCNFPKYATAMLEENEIAVCSSNFTNLSYNKANIVLMNDSLKNGGKVERENMLSVDDYLIVKEKIYKYKGINLNKNVLTLETTTVPQDQLYSTQIGFKTLPFKGRNFITKDSISLDGYKGKYLLIDFWAVWCGPCIQELPNLKTLYDKLDKTKIELVSIVGDSPSDGLTKMIEKHDITWPQILSDDTNKITQTYGVHSYPSTLLVNPEGIIVAKDLRGKGLEDKINELTVKNQ